MSNESAHTPSFLEPIPKTATVVRLPSDGVPYKEGSPESTGRLSLNAMTMSDESRILNPEKGVSFSRSVDLVLQKCIQEVVDINSLLSADKFYLFMLLRAVTYGQEYSFTWECGSTDEKKEVCGHENTASVKIPGDFQVKGLTKEDIEPFGVTLPVTGKTISFRLGRGYDEIAVDKYEGELAAKKKAGIMVADTTPLYRLARLVTAVDGNEITKNVGISHVVSFINSLPAKDIAALKAQMEYYTPGMNTEVSLYCEECRTMTKMDLPITVSFFRPDYFVRGEPVETKVRPDVLHGDVVPGDNEDGPTGTPVVSREAEGNQRGGDGARTA